MLTWEALRLPLIFNFMSFVDSLIDSTGSTLASVITWPLANYSNNRQNNMNRENMELGWKYQRDLQQQSSELQYENWLKQFNAQNAYNSPSSEVARMLAAGINPFVSNNGSTVTAGSSSMPAAASAPSSSSPSIASAPSLAGSFSEFSQGIKDISQAIGQNIHNSKAKAILDAELDKLLKDNANKDLENVIRGIEIDFLPKIKDAELRNILKDTDLKIAKVFNTNSDTALTDAKYDIEKARSVLMEKEGRLKEGQISELNIYLNKLDTLLQSQIDKNRASASSDTANAALASANAEQVRFYNDVLHSVGVKESLVREANERGRQAVNNNEISERQARQLDYLVEQAAYANDMKEFTYWSGQVQSFIGTLGNVASSFYAPGMLGKMLKINSVKNAPEGYTSTGGQLTPSEYSRLHPDR